MLQWSTRYIFYLVSKRKTAKKFYTPSNLKLFVCKSRKFLYPRQHTVTLNKLHRNWSFYYCI